MLFFRQDCFHDVNLNYLQIALGTLRIRYLFTNLVDRHLRLVKRIYVRILLSHAEERYTHVLHLKSRTSYVLNRALLPYLKIYGNTPALLMSMLTNFLVRTRASAIFKGTSYLLATERRDKYAAVLLITFFICASLPLLLRLLGAILSLKTLMIRLVLLDVGSSRQILRHANRFFLVNAPGHRVHGRIQSSTRLFLLFFLLRGTRVVKVTFKGHVDDLEVGIFRIVR